MMVESEQQKFLLKDRRVSVHAHIKKVKKNPNDRMLDKSGEFFLKPCVFKGLYYSSSTGGFWWVLLRFRSVPGGLWSVPDGFWSVLLGSRFSICDHQIGYRQNVTPGSMMW